MSNSKKPWNVQIFSTISCDRYFKQEVQEFYKAHAGYEFETHTCASPEKFFLTILYRERD